MDLAEKAEQCTLRLTRLTYEEQVFWVKRIEKRNLWLRLIKGGAVKTFEREKAALNKLADIHPAVPEIVIQGSDYFVFARLRSEPGQAFAEIEE